jgi:hypothetical protein
MAGPDNQQTKQFFIPIGEAPSVYAPASVAQQIINFETTIRSTLATVRGPTTYEPVRGLVDPSAPFGEMHGVFHAALVGGVADTLIVRSGTNLYRHAGWQRGWEELYTGLTSDTRGGSFPDQFVVLYGIKSLAIKNINEFLYGVSAERYRKDEKANLTEPEPLLMPFWQGSWHGVPQQERMPMEMFEFYLDMLAGVAKTVSEEHTLQLKGVGAFWNMLGSMHEISIPVFVLINCITKMFEKSHKELFERMKQGVLRTASVNLKEKQKRDKEGKPKPFPSYKEALLGKESLDSRGYVAVHQFLNLALESDKKQTEKDSKFLDDAYQTWVAFKKENTYEVFVECLKESSPELPDADVINLYNLATSGDNPDVPDFKLICKTLRAKDIHLVRKGGAESITKQKIDDLKTMTKMTRPLKNSLP